MTNQIKMILYWFILFVSLLLINIQAADVNKAQRLVLTVAEHKTDDSLGKPLKTAPEKKLIRVPRMDNFIDELTDNIRERRDVSSDVEQIWGMAKAVAITVFILISVCLVGCIVTTVYIFIRCCCGGSDNRKRNQRFQPTPQPIIIHTSSPPYQQQYYQQQAPLSPPPLPVPVVAGQSWQLENHPMLPQPSAPPHPTDESYMDRPPPYEKICAT